MQNHISDSSMELCQVLRDLRAELSGKVDLGVVTRIDQTIAILEASSHREDRFKLALLMLGAVFEHMPSIIKTIGELFRQ